MFQLSCSQHRRKIRQARGVLPKGGFGTSNSGDFPRFHHMHLQAKGLVFFKKWYSAVYVLPTFAIVEQSEYIKLLNGEDKGR